MKIYIASRLRNRPRCRAYRDELEAAGHTVTSRWLEDSVRDTYANMALRDLQDVRRANVLLLVGHVGRNGGCATELGVALERGLRVIHIAAELGDNVFTHVPEVEYFRTFREAIDALEKKRAA